MSPEQLQAYRVLPVITAIDVDSTVELSRALQRGGMRAVEITLRTDAALDSMRAIKAELPDLQVAAGTVTGSADLHRAIDAGCDFYVSPGLSDNLLHAASEAQVQLLPGVATASDVMRGLDFGLSCFKLFPAVAVGGLGLLKSLAGPFPQVRFCPTGGLNADNFREFLALPNVVCCGGSWMVGEELVTAGEWEQIESLARDAMTE